MMSWVAIGGGGLVAIFLLWVFYRLSYIRGYRHARDWAVDKYCMPIVKRNSLLLKELAEMAQDNDSSAQARNVRLLAENRRLKAKTVRMALRHSRLHKKHLRYVEDMRWDKSCLIWSMVESFSEVHRRRGSVYSKATPSLRKDR